MGCAAPSACPPLACLSCLQIRDLYLETAKDHARKVFRSPNIVKPTPKLLDPSKLWRIALYGEKSGAIGFSCSGPTEMLDKSHVHGLKLQCLSRCAPSLQRGIRSFHNGIRWHPVWRAFNYKSRLLITNMVVFQNEDSPDPNILKLLKSLLIGTPNFRKPFNLCSADPAFHCDPAFMAGMAEIDLQLVPAKRRRVTKACLEFNITYL